MSHRITIECNPLSQKSIKKAISALKIQRTLILTKWMNDFANDLATRIHEFVVDEYELADINQWDEDGNPIDARPVIPGIAVEYKGNKKGATYTFTVEASGERLAFIEFGAGDEASPGKYITKDASNAAFVPGSWSRENAKTYTTWVLRGKPGVYPYEQEAAHVFDDLIDALPALIEQSADEVFGKR